MPSGISRKRRAIGNPLELDRSLLAVDMGVATGMEFDDGGAKADGSLDLRFRRLDEQADADVRLAEPVYVRTQVFELPCHVEPALGRALLPFLRDDAGRMGLMPERDRKHLLGRRHFQVQWQIDLRHQPVDIFVGDVPPILAEVRRDSIGAGLSRQCRRTHGVGMVAAARVPNGRDVVDIDAETERFAHAAARLPGLIAGIAASSGGSASAS